MGIMLHFPLHDVLCLILRVEYDKGLKITPSVTQ